MKVVNVLPPDLQEVIDNGTQNGIELDDLVCLGQGSHGIAYRLLDNYVLKIFNNKAIAGGYLDYKYIEPLQGLPFVPILYLYEEKKYMIVEHVKGICLHDYYLAHNALPPNIKGLLRNVIADTFHKGIIPEDSKISEHVFWDEETSTIKIIDYGVCEFCSSRVDKEFLNSMMDVWLKDVEKEVDNYLKEMKYYKKK